MCLSCGVIAAWHLNGGGASAVLEGKILTDQGVSYSQGKFGQAAVFDGTSKHLLTSWGLVGAGHSRSVSLWIYPVTPTGGGPGLETYSLAGASGSALWSIYRITLAFGGSMWVRHGAVAIQGLPPTVNNWNHIVYTFDATTGVYKLYQDGIATAQGIGPDNAGANTLLNIGSSEAPLLTSGTRIDEVVIWNRALSQMEVENVYNLGVYPYCVYDYNRGKLALVGAS